MRVLVVFAVLASFYLANAMPFNDCRDHYELCGKWAKHQYCEMTDYKDYMSLVCPYSCGQCNDILSDLSASGKDASGNGDGQRAIPEVVADFENFEQLGSSSTKPDKKVEDNDDSSSQSLSGSGEGKIEPLFRASASKETEYRSHGEAEQQDEPNDQQKSISGSGSDTAGAYFWPVVRVEAGADDRGSDRELHLIRRSEISTPEQARSASDEGSGTNEATSGEQLTQRSGVPSASGSGQDVTSGEDDAPFDNSSADSESDSGCSSGYGCYDSEGEQGGDGGGINSRSVISQAEESAAASGSASGDFASKSNTGVQPHFDVTAGPYGDPPSGSGSGAVVLETGSLETASPEIGSGFVAEDEKPETDLHEIEDAIFETGIPLEMTRDTSSGSGSGIPSPPQSESYDDSETSGSGSGAAEKAEAAQLFVAPQHHKRITLMEKMMKLGKLQAIKITHQNVGASSRNEVPRVTNVDDNAQMQSDLGKGRKVSLVLNQDFHSGYANENSAAYDILANNLKQEVERALGSNAVVSEISFSEVREPIAHSPRFSKVMASFKLLGDVTKLEQKVKKGMINSLVVDKTFFHVALEDQA